MKINYKKIGYVVDFIIQHDNLDLDGDYFKTTHLKFRSDTFGYYSIESIKELKNHEEIENNGNSKLLTKLLINCIYGESHYFSIIHTDHKETDINVLKFDVKHLDFDAHIVFKYVKDSTNGNVYDLQLNFYNSNLDENSELLHRTNKIYHKYIKENGQ